MDISIYIDEQTDTKRKAKYRFRLMEGLGNNRATLKAIYFDDRSEAERIKKHLENVFNNFMGDLSQIPDSISNQNGMDNVSIPPSNG
jgi:hypothetical protein